MTNVIEEPQKEPQEKKPGGTQRRTVVIVGLVCVGVVAAIVAMNFDGLAAHSDVSGPTEQQHEATSAANTAPVILSLTPATDRIAPLDRCQVICEAEDEDSHSLTYTWTASQGDIVGEGATVEWSAPDAEGLFRLSVAVDDGNGGTDEYSTSVRVKNNYAPEFQSVSSFFEGVLPGASIPISCSALDADGDEITYQWRATYGEVFGEGDSIVWVAPEKLGSYVITVSAHDSYGGEAKRDVLISVTPSPTPRFGAFVVEPINHDTLMLDDDVWVIYKGRSCSVECVILEGDGPFTYTWSVDDGELTAEGAIATWEAPEEHGPATITVAATDMHGNTNTVQLLMYTEDCTCVFD